MLLGSLAMIKLRSMFETSPLHAGQGEWAVVAGEAEKRAVKLNGFACNPSTFISHCVCISLIAFH